MDIATGIKEKPHPNPNSVGISSATLTGQTNANYAVLKEISSEEQKRMQAADSYRFTHQLAADPSMTIPEIRKLVGQMLAEERFDQIFYKTGKSMATGKYSDAESSKEIIYVLENMNSAGVWLRLTRVDEATSRFDSIVERFIADLSEIYQQDIKTQTWKTFVTLFVSSPGAYTNYHMDHTWNFLLQVCGRKSVHLYDPLDEEVLTQEDKESWYMKDFNIDARAVMKDTNYDLGPGDGVHHPVNAPHWVQNGTEVSISLSIGLCLHKSNDVAKVYQANYLLRKWGLRPMPPNRSEWRDKLKVSLVSRWSDRNSNSLDGVVFSGGNRLKRFFRIGPSEPNQYEPK